MLAGLQHAGHRPMPDFESLLRITVSPAELVVRGTLMYWFLFLLLRFVLRRDVGSLAMADVLLLVVISDASQNAMAGGYQSVTDGVILVSTIAAWNYLLDWSAYRWPAVRRELISLPELMAKLREAGVESVADVKLAVMESDGEISVIRNGKP